MVGGCPGNCTGHGECLIDGRCLCEPGYDDADCSTVSAFSHCPGNCSGHGACVFGECRCDAGYGGDACDSVLYTCAKNCSGHGICSAAVSSAGLISYGCECEVGFTGRACDTLPLAFRRIDLIFPTATLKPEILTSYYHSLSECVDDRTTALCAAQLHVQL